MKEQYEVKIMDFFYKYKKDILEEQMLKSNITDKKYIKSGYYYFDFDAEINFGPDAIDYAIWDVEKNKFVYLEYPWRNKKGELIYNKIML